MQCRWPIMAFGYCRVKKCTRLWAHLLTACHTVHLIPSHPPKLLVRSGCLLAPFRLLAGALVAYLYNCLQLSGCLPAPFGCLLKIFFRLLACPSGCLPSFFRLLAWPSGCLPGRPAACRTHEVACWTHEVACLPSPAPCLPPAAVCRVCF